MSKSYGNTIPLFGDEKAAKKAIMGIVTDSKGMSDPKDPDTCIIFQLHKLFLDAAEQKSLADEYRNGLPYGEAKKKLLARSLTPFAQSATEFLLKHHAIARVAEVFQDSGGNVNPKRLKS